MKLICAKQGIELRLDENQVNTLVLENPAIFSGEYEKISVNKILL